MERWKEVEKWLLDTEGKINREFPEVSKDGRRIRITISKEAMSRIPDAPDHFKQRWIAQK